MEDFNSRNYHGSIPVLEKMSERAEYADNSLDLYCSPVGQRTASF